MAPSILILLHHIPEVARLEFMAKGWGHECRVLDWKGSLGGRKHDPRIWTQRGTNCGSGMRRVERLWGWKVGREGVRKEGRKEEIECFAYMGKISGFRDKGYGACLNRNKQYMQPLGPPSWEGKMNSIYRHKRQR